MEGISEPLSFEPKSLARAFYRHVESEIALRQMYPKHLGCSVSGLEAFLVRLVGGKSDWPSQPLHAFHRKLKIDAGARDAWVRCMTAALDETVPHPEARGELLRLFKEAATQLVNVGPVEESSYGRCPFSEAKGSLEYAWSQHEATDMAYKSVASGDMEKLKQVLPDVCIPLGDLLLSAATAGQLESLNVLIDFGADARQVSVTGLLLMEQPECAEFLLAHGASVGSVNGSEPPLIRSCRGDRGERPAEVRALLARGADPNERGREGRTALHYAARAGFEQVIELLLAAGADRNVKDAKGLTPLQHAEQRGKAGAVDALLGSETGAGRV